MLNKVSRTIRQADSLAHGASQAQASACKQCSARLATRAHPLAGSQATLNIPPFFFSFIFLVENGTF